MAPDIDLSRLNICFLAGTLGQGGAEQQLYYILQALCREGTQVRVLSLTKGEFWEEPIRRLGVPVIWVGRSSSRAWRLGRIFQELRKEPAGIVQSQHFFTNLYAAFAARALGSVEIGAIRNDVWSEVHHNGRLLGTMSLRLPRTLAANSMAAIRNATELGVPRARLQLLPNVVDSDRFRPAPKELSDAVRILSVGRMVPEKRFDRLLRVIALVRVRNSRPIEVWIAGDGPLRRELEGLARDLGLCPEPLKFLGAVADPVPLYQQADLLLLTSDHEGTPNVVLEAMACGLPVVATRVGGIPDIIQHEQTGLLAASETTEAIADCVLRLLVAQDARRVIGRNARVHIRENCAVALLPSILRGLYRPLLRCPNLAMSHPL